MKYIYSATGEKLCKEAKISGTTTKRYYAGGFEYDNGKYLDIVHHAEGIVDVSSSGTVFSYEYFLKDHLGNTRIAFKKDINNNKVLTQREVYYPFGMTAEKYDGTTNEYKYNGKELQNELGLNWYDYGARFYDAVVARFHTVDPKAEEYDFQTTYAYATNKPIKYIDVNGEGIGISPLGGLYNARINNAISQDEFNERVGQSAKMSKYPIMVAGMLTGNPIALTLLPTSLGLNIGADVLNAQGKSEKADEVPKSMGEVLGMTGDKVIEKVTGEESNVFQSIGGFLESIFTFGTSAKQPENLVEVVLTVTDIVDLVSVTVETAENVKNEIVLNEEEKEVDE